MQRLNGSQGLSGSLQGGVQYEPNNAESPCIRLVRSIWKAAETLFNRSPLNAGIAILSLRMMFKEQDVENSGVMFKASSVESPLYSQLTLPKCIFVVSIFSMLQNLYKNHQLNLTRQHLDIMIDEQAQPLAELQPELQNESQCTKLKQVSWCAARNIFYGIPSNVVVVGLALRIIFNEENSENPIYGQATLSKCVIGMSMFSLIQNACKNYLLMQMTGQINLMREQSAGMQV